jgi:hypothetical protein
MSEYIIGVREIYDLVKVVETKLDDHRVSVGAALTDLTGRVTALEKASDKAGERRWSLVPTWIATAVALALALLPYIH